MLEKKVGNNNLMSEAIINNDKKKKKIGGGNDLNVVNEWQYVNGDANTANIRTRQVETTTPGSGQAGTGVGYAESFANLTPEQKINYNTPDIESWTQYVIDYNKNQGATTTTTTETQNREDWTKTFNTRGEYIKHRMETGEYNWDWLANRVNTLGEEKRDFGGEEFEKYFKKVGYINFKKKMRQLYPYIYGGRGGSSNSTTYTGKTAFK